MNTRRNTLINFSDETARFTTDEFVNICEMQNVLDMELEDPLASNASLADAAIEKLNPLRGDTFYRWRRENDTVRLLYVPVRELITTQVAISPAP
jgi:hypothetical protein